MPAVRVLASELINQIAAGEVVERPASVVKELVENAIDAGARTIDVILEAGGKKLIEVRDDGSGMSAEDAGLAIERHATSKIRDFDDLTRVRTLGFRGEALPSIASVSRFTLTTFDGASEHAIELTIDPMTGERTTRPAARDRGTTISVRELFENVPARRKFLRSADAEFRAIVTVVSSYALSLPSHAFRLEHNGRVVLDLAAARSTRERVVQVLGAAAEEHLEEFGKEIGSARAGGFVTRGLRFGSRRNQFFFVNGRLVKDRVLTHAVSRATDAFDFEGHPAVVLFVEIEPEMVDVNVHPAKTEVRFRESSQVHVAVEHGIREALGGAEEGGGLLQPQSVAPEILPALSYQEPFAGRIAGATQEPRVDFTPLFQQRPVVQPPVQQTATIVEAEPQLGDLQGRIIGQYRLSYILLDTPGGLRLVDQHVAHERVLYDRYLSRIEAHAPATQHLLAPILYERGAAESAVLESHLDELRGVGFEIERFSGNAFAISAVPPELVQKDVDGFLQKLIDASLEEKSSHVTRVREKVCASLACQAAIKVHRPLSGEEMARVVTELLGSSNPFACPHGRPIVVDIKHIDIERHFHRR
ncbi:MAG TPA: DNA mismatch repair endonuclease MutL [Thermoanaerobaculia bacterium]|jgi:DNA mismatch repair protein MutL|nr:DNA mismatch repair endonuclease MutL [Thermoanaerobaculia bacterium]